ncbi:hypothetical protein EYF80_067952 [Liparis tanakae]|uniref:Uncharacterized protein n=1 Tax=Liparis tanakae TaxID=230148 RepID=A0A4Z2DZI2_9TELE|nr:hypothetical protein EYF80_067952 [Liparis tanakae]
MRADTSLQVNKARSRAQLDRKSPSTGGIPEACSAPACSATNTANASRTSPVTGSLSVDITAAEITHVEGSVETRKWDSYGSNALWGSKTSSVCVREGTATDQEPMSNTSLPAAAAMRSTGEEEEEQRAGGDSTPSGMLVLRLSPPPHVGLGVMIWM